MAKVNTEALIEITQYQQKLEVAQRLAAEVLKEGGDMGEGADGKYALLSDAVTILSSCIHHFSMIQSDLEDGVEL